jgi:hypothetical protein
LSAMETIRKLAGSFIDSIASGQTEVYNEFSLQHELGIFLRGKLTEFKVQFERNVSFFFPSKKRFTKREIDISVFTPDRRELAYAIELKYPRNGQYPEQMFSFCKDVAFAEELNASGFRNTGLIIFADDQLFYQGSKEGIYRFFRGGECLSGQIQKPTGAKDEKVMLGGAYSVEWKPIFGSLHFAVIEVRR